MFIRRLHGVTTNYAKSFPPPHQVAQVIQKPKPKVMLKKPNSQVVAIAATYTATGKIADEKSVQQRDGNSENPEGSEQERQQAEKEELSKKSCN